MTAIAWLMRRFWRLVGAPRCSHGRTKADGYTCGECR